MLKGFRDFLMRGNVVDLAIAVVVGAAFTALVGAFSKALIEPIIVAIIGAQKTSGATHFLGVDWNFALLFSAIVTFVITAAVVYFIFVLPMNKFREKFGKNEEEQSIDEEVALLREIRDLLKANQGPES